MSQLTVGCPERNYHRMVKRDPHLFPLSNRRMCGVGPQRYKSREFVLDAFDEAILLQVLRQEFGRLRIFERTSGPTGDVEWHETESITECDFTFHLYVPVDEPAIEGKRKRPRRTWLDFDVWRSVWIYGGRDSEKWSLSLPTLEPGSIRVIYAKDDELAHAATKRVWKTIDRVGTKRVIHRYPRPGEESDQEIRSDTVYGFHALEWCSRDPGRVLNGRIRPTVDFQVPRTAWYQDMREAVVKRYGQTLDDPGLPEIIERGAYAPINMGRFWRHLI